MAESNGELILLILMAGLFVTYLEIRFRCGKDDE